MMLLTEYLQHSKEVIILCTITALLVFIRAQKWLANKTNIVTYDKQTQVYCRLRKRINYAHRDPDVVVNTFVYFMKDNYIDRYRTPSSWLAECVSEQTH